MNFPNKVCSFYLKFQNLSPKQRYYWHCSLILRSLVAIFVVRAGVGRVPVGGGTEVTQSIPPVVIPGRRRRGVVIPPPVGIAWSSCNIQLPPPAYCSPIITQMSSPNRSFSVPTRLWKGNILSSNNCWVMD